MSYKNVLILAYDYPPINSIGAQRPYSWFTYFPLYGIHPIVVTRSFLHESTDLEAVSLGGVKCVIEQGKQQTLVRICSDDKGNSLWSSRGNEPTLKRKAKTALNVFSNYLGIGQGDHLNISRASKALARSHKIDFVIATGEPFSMFKYAGELAKSIGCGWAADYRDSWSTNTAISYSVFHKLVARFFESKWTKSADFITTAAESYRENLAVIHAGKAIQVVYNGFFEEYFRDLNQREENGNEGCICIGYLGTLYGHQPLEDFVSSLEQAKGPWKGKRLKFIFFGAQDRESTASRIRKAFSKLDNEVVLTEHLAHQDVLRQANQLDGLLLLTSQERPMLYAKVFDYLALQLPILNFRPDNSDIDKVLANKEGVYPCVNSKEVALALLEIAERDGMKLANDVSHLTRKRQAGALASLILDTLKKRNVLLDIKPLT